MIEPIGTMSHMPVPKGTTIDPARTRAAILAAATEVLYERGIDGVGVAELCARIGVSKETLYRHFGTKDGLVLAMLQARSARIHGWLADAVASAGEDPAAQLSAVFEALGRWYEEPTFRGCAMMNAAAQHHDRATRTITALHLNGHLDLLHAIATRAGAPAPDVLARQLLMIIEGATIVADQHGATKVSEHARAAALALLASAAGERGSADSVSPEVS